MKHSSRANVAELVCFSIVQLPAALLNLHNHIIKHVSLGKMNAFTAATKTSSSANSIFDRHEWLAKEIDLGTENKSWFKFSTANHQVLLPFGIKKKNCKGSGKSHQLMSRETRILVSSKLWIAQNWTICVTTSGDWPWASEDLREKDHSGSTFGLR